MEIIWVGLLLMLSVASLWWWNEIWYVAPLALAKQKRSSSPNSKNTPKIPPGHLGFPFFGEIFTFLWYFKIVLRPDDFINSKRRRYGDKIGAYRTHLFGSPSIIACSPSLCKLVMHSSDAFKMEWPTAEAIGSNSVVTLQGSRHDRIKNFIVNFINRPDALSNFTLQVQPSIINALESWSHLPKIKAFPELQKLSLNYMGRYFANLETGSETDTYVKLLTGISKGMRAHTWNFPGTAFHHALKCRKKLIEILKKELEKKKQNNNVARGETKKDDLMDGLMQVKDEDGNYLKDEEVVDNVLSSIHVGHASTAFLVAWSLYFLAKSPHLLLKLREENMALSKEKQNGHITYKDITKLRYTNKVVEEVIRMANLSGFVFRTATKDIEFQGYLIPKGWKVIVWLRYLHTDPENFEDPMCFNPDRWDTRPRPGSYLPFGGGARSCPGNTLVRVNLAIFLHHLSVGYKWELLNPDTTILYLSHPHLSDGLEISFRKI